MYVDPGRQAQIWAASPMCVHVGVARPRFQGNQAYVDPSSYVCRPLCNRVARPRFGGSQASGYVGRPMYVCMYEDPGGQACVHMPQVCVYVTDFLCTRIG